MRSIRLPLGAGSEPEVIEVDDCREAVGEVICNYSPNGMHVVSLHKGKYRCRYCHEIFK